ncbi:MAG TPA: AMP-binding protein [Burkholderiaceae bacterium]|nr:AMP-binding protein [Burkholderiaceae bacterium]
MDCGTVHRCFERTAAASPEAPFLHVLPETARNYSIVPGDTRYGDARAAIGRMRDAFAAAGWGHGHRAGLLLENRPAFFGAWIALNALGVSVVPISAEMRAAELDYLIGHSEIDAAIVWPSRVRDVEAAAARVGRDLPVIAAIDGSVECVRAPLPAPHRAAPIAGAPDADTECALLYTSGTTGRPKGCVLPNAYYLLAADWYATIGGLCTLREREERLITPLPMVHMNAMAYSTMAMIRTGGCVIPLDRFHPRSWWDSVRESGATIVHYLGVMPPMLMSQPPDARDRAHRVRFGFGAGVDRRIHAAFEQRFGFPLLEAWAMTETGAGAVVIANREPRHVGTACFGRPEASVQVRIVGDDGNDVGADAPGELWVRAAGDAPRRGFFREYLKDPAATGDAWAGGWFHTGDIVRRDADGYLYFIDRKKNVIRRSGENIAAVEVESVLRRHPAVREVAVAATPDPVRGDEVLACVVAADAAAVADARGRAETATAIVAYCLEQLAYFKAPGWVAFVEQLPLTSTQKIQRGQLKELAATLPGTDRCVDTRHLKKRQA